MNSHDRQDFDRNLVVIHTHRVHLFLLRLLQHLEHIRREGGGGGGRLHMRLGLGLGSERQTSARVVREKEVGENKEKVVEDGVCDGVLTFEGENTVIVASREEDEVKEQCEGLTGLVTEGYGIEEAKKTGVEGIKALSWHEFVDG